MPTISQLFSIQKYLASTQKSIYKIRLNCNWNWTQMYLHDINQLTKKDFENKNIMIYKYVFDLNAFNFYMDELILKEFVFEADILRDAQAFLHNIANGKKNEIIYVSVHVRRTDFKEWMTQQVGGFVASKEFYTSGIH